MFINPTSSESQELLIIFMKCCTYWNSRTCEPGQKNTQKTTQYYRYTHTSKWGQEL